VVVHFPSKQGLWVQTQYHQNSTNKQNTKRNQNEVIFQTNLGGL
jgi:hypothetical protein